MTHKQYLAEVWPFLDRLIENPAELFGVQVLADKLDELGQPQRAAWLRKWKEGEQPGTRHEHLWRTGESFFIVHSLRSWWIELWCILIEVGADVPVDFSYMGGRGVMRHGGSRKQDVKVRNAARRLQPFAEFHYKVQSAGDRFATEFFPGHFTS